MKIGNLDVYGIIYKITNTVNGKIYIGQTIDEKGFNGRYYYKGVDIERVYNYHKAQKKYKDNYNAHLLNSIKKYGFRAFEVSKIFDVAFSKEELDIKEMSWISIYDSCHNGYNNNFGGDNSTFSLETIRKISRPIICLNDGKEFLSSREVGEYYGISISKINTCCSQKVSYIRINNIRYVFRDKIDYDLLTEQDIQCILNDVNEINKGKNHHRTKEIYCITYNTKFDTIEDACTYYNIEKHQINSLFNKSNYVLIGDDRTAWCYYDDYLHMNQEEIDNLIYKTTKEYRSEVLRESHLGKFKGKDSACSKTIRCITTGEIFYCIRDAIKKYNNESIYTCLRGKTKTSGKHPITGERLQWEYC